MSGSGPCLALIVSFFISNTVFERSDSCLSLVAADMSGVDWMVRHGRSLALAVAVKCAPEKLCGKEYCDTVMETILNNATADRVSRKFAACV